MSKSESVEHSPQTDVVVSMNDDLDSINNMPPSYVRSLSKNSLLAFTVLLVFFLPVGLLIWMAVNGEPELQSQKLSELNDPPPSFGKKQKPFGRNDPPLDYMEKQKPFGRNDPLPIHKLPKLVLVSETSVPLLKYTDVFVMKYSIIDTNGNCDYVVLSTNRPVKIDLDSESRTEWYLDPTYEEENLVIVRDASPQPPEGPLVVKMSAVCLNGDRTEPITVTVKTGTSSVGNEPTRPVPRPVPTPVPPLVVPRPSVGGVPKRSGGSTKPTAPPKTKLMPSKEAVDGRRLYTKAKNAHKAGDKYSKLEQFKAAEQSYAVALEHFKAAERQLTDAIKLTPEKPYPYYVRGAVRFNIPGKKDDADADFQSGSDKERQHPEWTAVLLGLLTQIQGADRTRLTEFRSSIKAP